MVSASVTMSARRQNSCYQFSFPLSIEPVIQKLHRLLVDALS